MTEQMPEATNDDEAPALDTIGEGDIDAGDEIEVDDYGEPQQWRT